MDRNSNKNKHDLTGQPAVSVPEFPALWVGKVRLNHY